MALASNQQVIEERCDYVVPFQTERGGVLSLTTLSGIQYATYEPNPDNNTVPLGIQQYDFEEVDLFRAVAPWQWRRAYPEFTPLPYITLGEVITNAVHPNVDSSTIRHGAPAYLAESGLITSNTTWSNRRIGTFHSTLNDPTIGVSPTALGPSLLRVAGNEAIVNPDPVIVNTAGWVRIRIQIT